MANVREYVNPPHERQMAASRSRGNLPVPISEHDHLAFSGEDSARHRGANILRHIAVGLNHALGVHKVEVRELPGNGWGIVVVYGIVTKKGRPLTKDFAAADVAAGDLHASMGDTSSSVGMDTNAYGESCATPRRRSR